MAVIDLTDDEEQKADGGSIYTLYLFGKVLHVKIVVWKFICCINIILFFPIT